VHQGSAITAGEKYERASEPDLRKIEEPAEALEVEGLENKWTESPRCDKFIGKGHDQ
jgi:hypothetical protein